MRIDPAARFHCRDEIIFHMPVCLQVGRQFRDVQGAIPDPAGMHHVRAEIVGQRAKIAVNLEPVSRCLRVDRR